MLRCAVGTAVFWLLVVCAASAQDSLNARASTPNAAKPIANFQFPISLTDRHLHIALADSQTVISLPDSFIIAGSDSLVWQHHRLQRGLDYVIEPARQQLRLLIRPRSDALDLYYEILPIRIPRRLLLFTLSMPESTDTGLPATTIMRSTARRDAEVAGANLNKRGSLVRGVSIGTNQTLKVDSGLRLEVSGRVADKVDIVAALTDQNTPIQPEGSTQTLQEIDKVFVQLKSENVRATLGDYELSLSNPQSPLQAGEFTRYYRKLQGAMVATEFDQAALTFSAAVSRGRFTTNEFRGIEGNQGPYQLTGDRGQIDIIVLAGTERVWIDGQLLTRGENNDYIIEYGNGQITFTRNRLITADSRLTVDFQFSDERFRRSLYAANAGLSAANERVRIQGTFIREADDQDNPLAFSLTPEDRTALAAAGDSLAFLDGARKVTPGTGAYVLRDGVFNHVGVGADSGDYNVTFSDLGPGRGDYEYVAFGNYRYVAPGKGRYGPFILLTPAQRHDLVDGRVELRPWQSLSLIHEMAVSNRDLNLYSPKDDGNNNGRALLSQLSWQPSSLRFGSTNLGTTALQVRYRSRGDRFRDIDRSDVIEFNRRWDVPDSRTALGEDILEANARYDPAAGLSVHGGYGRLARSDDLLSNRWEAGTEWARPRWPSLSYQIEQIQRRLPSGVGARGDNDWLRQRGRASYVIGRLQPLISYEAERKTDADTTSGGFRFDSYGVGLNLLSWQRMTASASFNYRRDDLGPGDHLTRYSAAMTQSYLWSLESWHSLSAALSFTHRERDFADSTADTRADLADLTVRFAPWQRALTTDWHYQFTNTQVARQERVFIKVPEGQGSYRFDTDLSEYVPDPFGEYVLRIIPTSDFVPVVEVRASTTWRFSVAALQRRQKSAARLWRWLAPLSTETQLRVEEKTRDANVSEIYRLRLSRFLQEGMTIFGSQNLRQDLYLWENSREKSFRYRLIVRKELNDQFLEGSSRSNQLRHEFRLTTALSPSSSGRFEYIRNREDRAFKIAGRQDRFLRSNAFSADLSHRPRPEVELATFLGLNLDQNRIAPSPTNVRALFVRPRLVYSFRQRGRLRSEIEWVEVQINPSGRVLPFELAGGNRGGATWRWNVAFEYRLSSNIQATMSYDGRREPDRPQTLHLGKIEMRAFF